MVLGKFWPYVTPEYLFHELTMPQVGEYLELVPAELRSWIVVNRKQDLSWITGRIGKVIHGD